jgi:hypothetical protein
MGMRIEATGLSINGGYVRHDKILAWLNCSLLLEQPLLRLGNLKLEFMLLLLHPGLGMLELNLDLQGQLLLAFELELDLLKLDLDLRPLPLHHP